MNYEKLSIKLPEGEALTYLTDRALAWQQKAEKALRIDEVVKELDKIDKKKLDKMEEESEEGSESETENPTKLSVKKLPEIKLSAKVQSQLENLMLEGNSVLF